MFRKVIATFLALVICYVSLGACSKEQEMMTMDEYFKECVDPSYPIEREYEGVRFFIEDATSKGASIRFENRNKVPVFYSETFLIFIKTDSGYRLVKDLAFDKVLRDEPPYDYLDFVLFYKKTGLDPGLYRIFYVTSFPKGPEPPYSNSLVYLYTDFEISK